MQHRRVFGSYDVTILKDGVFTAPSDILTHVDGPDALDRLWPDGGKPDIAVDVNCFLLQGPAGTMLVDAGTGAAWGEGYGHARAALAVAGVERERIERVLLTHLHGDHALGLFDGDDLSFPNAEIWVPKADLDFFTDPAARASVPAHRSGGFAVADRLLREASRRIRPIEAGLLLPEIRAIDLPGHTPGQTGYLIGDAGEGLLLWGDALHLGDVQSADPGIGVIYDADGAVAAATRREVLDRAARDGWTVSGGHVTGFIHVVRQGGSYRTEPA